MIGLTSEEELLAHSSVISETADAALLGRPLRSMVDIEEIECVPLEERLRIDNLSHLVALAIEARNPLIFSQSTATGMCAVIEDANTGFSRTLFADLYEKNDGNLFRIRVLPPIVVAARGRYESGSRIE